uniref:Reverse transcriptase domain-containing protein n=1 Tax=Mesocestoides corti TaxID=53468 RepID=A0A5K3EWN9_MESCO
FGLQNSAKTFQRFIQQVLSGLYFVFSYVDNVPVASENQEEHLGHMDIVFRRINGHGMNVNPTNRVFGVSELELLGYTISAAAQTLQPLTNLLKDQSKNQAMTNKARQAFRAAKEALETTITLAYQRLHAPLSLLHDASLSAAGAGL